jgi:FkbM family methyltransferase
MLKNTLRQVLPDTLVNWMRSNPAIHRLHCGAAARMTIGIGAGLSFDPGPSNAAYGSGNNELPVQQALAACLEPNGVLYDIGANVGFFSVIAAKLVGPGGSVYAFEPVADNAARARLNVRLNGFRNVQIIEKAVSSQSGTAELWIAAYSGGAALTTTPAPHDAKNKIRVQVVSIDDLIFRENWAAPTVVKIDVEGAEIDVLKGMSRTLREVRPVLIYEIDDETPAGFSHKYNSCEKFLQNAGYTVQRLEESYAGINWIVGHAIAMSAGRQSEKKS